MTNSDHDAEKLHNADLSNITEQPKDEASSREEELGDADKDEIVYPTGKVLAAVIASVLLNNFLVSLDQTIVATAIPKITDDFHGLDKVSWYGSAYFMTFGGFQSCWGKIYRYFPLKIAFLVAICVFELGSLLCGVAPNSIAFIIGRAIGGMGGAGIMTGGYTITAFSFHPKIRPTFVGVLSATYGIAAICGPIVGGVFSDKVTWRWCFYINLPIGGLTMLLITFLFRTPTQSKPVPAPLLEKIRQVDLPGVALVTSGIVCFILAMEYAGQRYAWNSSIVIGLLVGSVLIFGTFAVWQWYLQERAIIVPRLVKQKFLILSAVWHWFFAGSYFIVLYYLPIYFQSVHGVSPIQSGVNNLPMIIPVIFAAIAGGTFMGKTRHAAPLALFGAILGTLCAGLLYSMDKNTSTARWAGYQILGGVGWGGSWVVPMVTVQAYAKPADMSSSVATVSFFQTIGGAFALSAAQCAFGNRLISTLATSAPGFDPMMVIGTGATQLRTTFSAEELPGIIEAYMQGVKVTFALSTGICGVALLLTGFWSYKRLPKVATKDSAPAGG